MVSRRGLILSVPPIFTLVTRVLSIELYAEIRLLSEDKFAVMSYHPPTR